MDSRLRGNDIKGCGNDRVEAGMTEKGKTRLPRTASGARNDKRLRWICNGAIRNEKNSFAYNY